MRFGVELPTYGAYPFSFVASVAVKAEKLGFDSVWACDHLFFTDNKYEALGSDPNKPDTLDPWVVLSFVSAKTGKVKLGTCVTPIQFRNPAILAKTVATIDVASDGRFIFGAGAGWNETEFRAYDITWDPLDIRIQKMREGIDVMKRLWLSPCASYEGKYYRINKAPLWPKPVQKPHPPIWFGGGSTWILRATADLGDGWVPFGASAPYYKERLTKLRRLLREAGRDPESVEPACELMTYVSDDHDEAIEVAKPRVEAYVREPAFLRESFEKLEEQGIYGGPDLCISRIEDYFKAGVRHLIFSIIYPKKALECLELYSEKVFPYFSDS